MLDPGQVELARELYSSRRDTTAEIARRLKVGRRLSRSDASRSEHP